MPKRIPYTLFIASLIFLAFISCRGAKNGAGAGDEEKKRRWDWNDAQVQYELLQAELRLAKTAKPYLVIDPINKELVIKLKGAIVWGRPFNISDANSGDLNDFSKRFLSSKHLYIRTVVEKHLFAASKETPDSILDIVGKAVNIDPELMQRAVPERFLLSWGHGLILDIRTNVEGVPMSRFKNTMMDLKRTFERPFGESQLIVKMTPEEALTLYRASDTGLPTLVFPPH